MKQKGFTLIEIIIAMVIIGILVTAASLNYEKVRAKGRDTKRKADISNLAIALDSYYSFEKKYPGERSMTYYVDSTTHLWRDLNNTNLFNTELLSYLNPLPVEQGPNFGGDDISSNPCSGNLERNYNYITEDCAVAGGPCSAELVGGYALIARLELYDDPDVSTTAQSGCGKIDVLIGSNTTLTLTGHPLFILSK